MPKQDKNSPGKLAQRDGPLRTAGPGKGRRMGRVSRRVEAKDLGIDFTVLSGRSVVRRHASRGIPGFLGKDTGGTRTHSHEGRAGDLGKPRPGETEEAAPELGQGRTTPVGYRKVAATGRASGNKIVSCRAPTCPQGLPWAAARPRAAVAHIGYGARRGAGSGTSRSPSPTNRFDQSTHQDGWRASQRQADAPQNVEHNRPGTPAPGQDLSVSRIAGSRDAFLVVCLRSSGDTIRSQRCR